MRRCVVPGLSVVGQNILLGIHQTGTPIEYPDCLVRVHKFSGTRATDDRDRAESNRVVDRSASTGELVFLEAVETEFATFKLLYPYLMPGDSISIPLDRLRRSPSSGKVGNRRIHQRLQSTQLDPVCKRRSRGGGKDEHLIAVRPDCYVALLCSTREHGRF
ncbi:hypothetical protein SDC9_148795 [bioreactor metagenome]|uniref:Uncharacterized protein n=1 Tax=bioreactor metagenome TaxID=1076179 RepID=A0A645EHV3_9ZZZZ